MKKKCIALACVIVMTVSAMTPIIVATGSDTVTAEATEEVTEEGSTVAVLETAESTTEEITITTEVATTETTTKATTERKTEPKKKTTTEQSKTTTKKSSNESTDGWIAYTATGYCPCAKCCGKTNGITASGKKAKANHTIAVDRRKIPLGTTVEIKGYGTFVAEDTGGAIKGNKIDIYFATHQEALNWGRRTVYLRIVD